MLSIYRNLRHILYRKMTQRIHYHICKSTLTYLCFHIDYTLNHSMLHVYVTHAHCTIQHRFVQDVLEVHLLLQVIITYSKLYSWLYTIHIHTRVAAIHQNITQQHGSKI